MRWDREGIGDRHRAMDEARLHILGKQQRAAGVGGCRKDDGVPNLEAVPRGKIEGIEQDPRRCRHDLRALGPVEDRCTGRVRLPAIPPQHVEQLAQHLGGQDDAGPGQPVEHPADRPDLAVIRRRAPHRLGIGQQVGVKRDPHLLRGLRS